ncbi:MAG: hypothetical protein HY773_01095 [Candidatus Terrybacteria bacterium]|nr:hypothetical protein [Candidatus Terrybacteria bacterium]
MKVIILVLFAVALPFTALASETDFYFQVQSLDWREYDLNDKQLVKESGPIFGMGYTGKYYIPKPLVLKPRIELFGGVVDYDGQTWGGDPVSAETGFLGVKLEADLGLNFPITLDFPLENKRFSIEPFAGLGNRQWTRHTGYFEDWNIFYSRFGLRVVMVEESDKNEFFAEGALKLPISNKMTADLTDLGFSKITLRPGKKPSFYIEGGIRLSKFKISLFYEGLRFLKAPDVDLGTRDGQQWFCYQPESKADIYGLNLGYSF